MAFASAITGRTVVGNKHMAWGTFTNGASDSGGSITTGLLNVEVFLYNVTSHLGTESAKVTRGSSGAVTVVTSTGADGEWLAIGI